jgi:hypothetical protein
MLKPGDRVAIVKGPRNSELIGRTATVLRPGFGTYWIKLDDGGEKVWKKKWLLKLEAKNVVAN